MAENDTAVGTILEIPPQALRNIKKAEEAIWALHDASKKTAAQVYGDFSKRMPMGVDAFIKKVKEAESLLGRMAMPKIDATSFSTSISEIAQAMATVDKSSTTGANRLSRIADSIAKLSATQPSAQMFQEIANGITAIGNTSQQTIANVSALAQTMASLAANIRTVQNAQRAQSDGTATASQYNKLYKEQADLIRQINIIKDKGNNATLDELTSLSKLQARYDEIERRLDKLNKKKQTAASELADWQGQGRLNNAFSHTTINGAINYAQQAKSLKELQDAYKNLKQVMSTVDPKSAQWQQMNQVYGDTKKRIDAIRTAMGELHNQSQRTNATMSQLRNQIAAAFSVQAIKGFIDKVVQTRAEFELQNVALRAILQNKDEADRIFAQVQQMAMQSPFTIMQLNTYTKQLAAYRIESSKLLDTTKMLADVSAGLGTEMSRLILAYGQVKSANYLRACLGIGTPVMLYDGTFKNVEDIVVGDVLMGDDEKPRNVSKLYRGEQMMYRVSYKGGEFRCNEHHILTVYDALNEKLADVFVFDYIKEPHRYQGVKRINGKYEVFPLKVEADKIDTYYGFSINGNHRFIIQDNIVTHNTEVRQFTEAGLNIAGELATYFSELKGEMITVGDVMEMITKRMVRFEDVEEVFKRVTGAGGLFYDMQKKQSESLMGQLQRITDAISIMMNEIGQSNQGAISSMLTLVRILINNWKIVVNLLYGAGAAMAAYAVKTTAAAIAQGNFNASSKGLVGVLAKVKGAVISLLNTLKANPYIVLIGAAVAAGAALYDLVKKTNEVKASYDNIIIGLAESSSKLDGISKRIEDAGEKIESTKDEMSRLTKGTAEYTAAAEANKKAVTEQYRALQELRNKFPEVYDEITNTTEKTEGLTAAINEFKQVTRMATIISTMLEESVTWYNPDDIKKDFEQVSKAQNVYNAYFAKTEAFYNAVLAKADAIYNTKKAEGELTVKEASNYQKLLNIRNSTLSTEQKMQTIYTNGFELGLRNIKQFYDFRDNWSDLDGVKASLRETRAEAEREADALMQYIIVAGGATSVETFKQLPPEAQEAAKKAGEKIIKESGWALDKVQRDILRRKIEIPIGIRFDFGDEQKKKLSYLQETINEYIDKHPNVNLSKLTAQDDPDQFFKSAMQSRKQNLEDAKRYTNAKVRLDNKETNAQLANTAKVAAAEQKAMLEHFGYIEEDKKKSSRGGGRDTILELWKNRLKALQDFYKRYEELQKNFSDAESLKKVQSAFAKLFNTLKIDMDEVVGRGMGKEGLTDNINAMLEQVRKARPQLADDFEKAWADVKVQIDVEIQKEALDKIKNDMQNVADNYELSETFRKLGVTTDLVFMLGGKPTTLDDYRKYLEDTYKQTFLVEEEYGKEGVEAYKEQLKKIEQLEQKNAVERAKNYIKYLTESLGERAQIEVKAMREIEAIRSDDTLDDFSKQQAALQKRKKMLEDLAKVDMDNLKSSDVYVSVFKDLENASKEQLQFVLNKLRELQSTFKDLSPAQVRSIANDMKKLEDAIADKDSFKNLGATLKDVIAFQRNRNDLLQQQTWLQERLLETQKHESAAQVELTDAQIKLNAILDKSSEEYKEQEELVRRLQMRLKLNQNVVEKTQEDLNKTTEDINNGESASKRFSKAWAKVVEILNGVSSAIGDISEGLDNMGLMTDALADAFESTQSVISNTIQVGTGLAQAFISKNPIEKVAGAFQVLGGAVKLVGSLFNIGDKKKERQIKRLQEKVEDLGKAYENLHNAMEEAYRFNDYNAGYEASMKNLEAQARAYDEMIRLEEAKKKTDKNKVKEYKDAREEIEKARKELREERYEEYGSISKKGYQDEAEASVSAWLDAYKEMGDGLDALTEHWDEFFENLVMKQAASSVVSNRMAKYIQQINNAIDSGDTGLSLSQTFAQIGENLKSELGSWNEDLKAFFDALGFKGGSGDLVLSDLQKGIQNITEPQAAAIEAYLNSMRFAVSRHTEQLDILIATIQAQYGTSVESPVVSELKGIRGVLDNIYSTMRSVIVRATGGDSLRIS